MISLPLESKSPVPGMYTPSGISDVVMCFRQGSEGRGGGRGEAARWLLITEVEKEGGGLVLLFVWGMDCIGSLLRLARLVFCLGLAVNAWTLFMSSGLQC